jgi:very-short-patch-repair endonuclease
MENIENEPELEDETKVDDINDIEKETEIIKKYPRNIEELIPNLTKFKDKLCSNLKKNFKEHHHYIIIKSKATGVRGGRPKTVYLLTEEAFELLKNSFNFRNRYIIDIIDNIKKVNISMCIENQTVGFIENTFKNILDVERQFRFGKYKVDLYFLEHNLIIECDENDHIDRNVDYEAQRQNYLLSLGKIILRFNPNHEKFELSSVLNQINKILFDKHDGKQLILM